MKKELNFSVGLLFMRLLLGVIFMMQGYGKVFTWGLEGVYASGFAAFEKTFLPVFLLKATVYFTSYAELIGGALLILGLFRSYTYYVFAAVLLIVSFGHGLQSPIWDLQHVMYRSLLLVPLLMFPQDKDSFSLDHLFQRAGRKS